MSLIHDTNVPEVNTGLSNLSTLARNEVLGRLNDSCYEKEHQKVLVAINDYSVINTESLED